MRVQSLILALAASLLCSNVFAQTRDIGLQVGLNVPREKQVYEKVGSLTMDDLLATHAKWIKDRTYVYAILGDPADLDLGFLKTLGPVQQVTLEEIFGY